MATPLSRMLFDLLLTHDPVRASKYRYRKVTGKELNLEHPQDFNEKLQWLKLFWQHPLVVQCGDKYTMREYVSSRGCPEVLNRLYAVYSHASEIEWENLPEKFALKCSHGCGFNIICADKSKLDRRQAAARIDRWLKTRYGRYSAEIHYAFMEPRILCEEYIETEAGFLPNDYKIYCNNGVPRVILVCTERNAHVKYDYADTEWNMLDLGSDSFMTGSLPPRPSCLDSMLEYARILSEPFPFVRLDFYDFSGKPVLGEMTFTPGACMATCYKESGLAYLGGLIRLPEPYPGTFRRR